MPCSSSDNPIPVQMPSPGGTKQQLSAAHPRRGVMRLMVEPPTTDMVVRYMGLPGEEAGNDDLVHTVRGAMALAEPLLQPVAMWGLLDLQAFQDDSLQLTYPDTTESFTLPCQAALFKGATHVQVSLLTLGPQLEALLAQTYDDDPLLAMACDAVGSATLAAAGVAFFTKRQAALAHSGLDMQISFVPGCQALPLSAQVGIFQVLKPEQIGVQLSESCLMHPAKSATSVYPVAAQLPSWMKKVSPCQLCNLRSSCNFKATKSR